MSQAYEPTPVPSDSGRPVFPADPNAVPPSGPPTSSSNGRCLLLGCVGVFITGIMLILCAGFGTYFAVRKQVEKFTATAPNDLPTIEYSEEKLAELENRIESFQSQLADEKAEAEEVVASDEVAAEKVAEATDEIVVEPALPKELVLSADDINALITAQESLRGKLFVKIAEDKVSGEISIPVESFVPGSKGRFLNGSATFDVRLDDGVLVVTVESAEIKGEPLPESIMQAIRKENLAKDVYRDEANAKMIRRFESIRVEGDKIIAKLRD